MRQVLGRLLLLAVVILAIFGLYRLITVEPLAPLSMFSGATPVIFVDAEAGGGSLPYSQAALDAAHRAGAGGFYLPLYLTWDGQLVAAASDDLSALTGEPGVISQHTLAELNALRAAGGAGDQGFVTLTRLAASFPDILLLVDLRDGDQRAVDAMARMVEQQAAAGRVVVKIDDQALAESLRRTMPALATAFTDSEVEAFLTTRRLGLSSFYRPPAPVLLIDGSDLTAGIVATAHRLGVQAVARNGTVDEELAEVLDGIIVR